MRTIGGAIALLVVAVAILVTGRLFDAPPASAAPAQLPVEVVEQNLDVAGRIQVSLPNVDDDGRLLVADPRGQPVQRRGFVEVHLAAGCDPIYTVPTGKRLTLEYISARVYPLSVGNAGSLQLMVWTQDTDPNQLAVVDIPTTTAHTTSGYASIASEQLQLFVDAGNVIDACTNLEVAETHPMDLILTWSGHLEDLP